MKKIFWAGTMSALMLTACKKDNETATAATSLEQQKVEYQKRELEIEKQKLAIEREKLEYETQKKADSIAKINSGTKAATVVKPAAVAAAPRVITKTKTVYRERPVHHSSSQGTYAAASQGSASPGNYSAPVAQAAPQKRGLSKTAKGAIIGTAGGAAVGAIVAKKNRGLGAVIGGIVGGATGYTIGHSKDKQDGRIP